jgi:hypothetical protein
VIKFSTIVQLRHFKINNIKGVTNIFTRELRAVEAAIETVLKNEWYDSSQVEIDQFIHDWRVAIKDHVRIHEGTESPVSIVFSPAIALSTPSSKKPHPNQKLTEDDLKFIHENKDMTAASLSRILKVSDMTVARVRRADVEVTGADAPFDQREQSPLCDDLG